MNGYEERLLLDATANMKAAKITSDHLRKMGSSFHREQLQDFRLVLDGKAEIVKIKALPEPDPEHPEKNTDFDEMTVE